MKNAAIDQNGSGVLHTYVSITWSQNPNIRLYSHRMMNDADDQDANRINDWSSGLMNENVMMVNKVHDGDELSGGQKEAES